MCGPEQTVAVVGGGVFGVASALALARAGFRVSLFEQRDRLMDGTSRANAFRLHRGYHYPRSRETIVQARDGEESFRQLFSGAVLDGHDAYYVLAKENSKTGPSEYLRVLNGAGLGFTHDYPPGFTKGMLSLGLKVEEGRIDIDALRELSAAALKASGVEIRTGIQATPALVESFGAIVIATYANLNEFAESAGFLPRKLKFELCEIAIVELPLEMAGSSIVVMDGPFFCLDPMGKSKYHLWYDVEASVHSTHVGIVPVIPTGFRGVVDAGPVPPGEHTNFDRFVENAKPLMPLAGQVKHLASLFTVRAVLPDREETDSRPTQVNHFGSKYITVFSGKLGSAATAAAEVVSCVESIFHSSDRPTTVGEAVAKAR